MVDEQFQELAKTETRLQSAMSQFLHTALCCGYNNEEALERIAEVIYRASSNNISVNITEN